MSSNTEQKLPPIISVSSGKGGVGKTLIALNLARVLSWSGRKILLVDLDLYNRGSTTLASEVKISDQVTVAEILEFATGDESILEQDGLASMILRKEIDQVKDSSGQSTSVYLLASTRTDSIVSWDQYTHDILKLRSFFEKAIRILVNKYGFDCVVFDCRPGPEPLFLAAAGISSDIILVTEADRVTLNGNINLFNYLSKFYQNDYEVLRNVRFIINRIPKRYDSPYIQERYLQRLNELFKSRPVLAAIPFDEVVFQSFGQHRFVVDQFPGSLFSRHIAAIAGTLISSSHPSLLGDRCRDMAATLHKTGLGTMVNAAIDVMRFLLRPPVFR